MNYKEICTQVCDLAREVGAFIREESKNKAFANKIEEKGLHNFVTYVDKTSEKRIVEKLSQIIPEAGYIAEEGTSTKVGEVYNWIIDPLDGTTNFIHGLPPFAISIALKEGDEIVIGVVYEINLDECFHTWKGGKAYCNENEIHVSSAQSVSNSLIITGFPYFDYHKLSLFLNTMDYFMKKSHGMRRLGSAATDLAYIACGRGDAFYEYNLNAWDVAAGAFLVQQAGGKVSDFSGDNNYLFGAEIIASNGFVHKELEEVIYNIMIKSNFGK
jgi:myo-inositol-1(or 4)-monophosphatase